MKLLEIGQANRVTISLILPALSGCSSAGAPTYELFGSYFPSWLLYGVLSVLLALMARVVMIKTGLHLIIPHQLLVCTSIGFSLAALLWLSLG